MSKTAEMVSIGHPDKIADYISSSLLDKMIKSDPYVKYAVEVMIKNNTVVLGGEVTGNVSGIDLLSCVKSGLRDIGYDERYAGIWGENALDINKINIVNMIGVQSNDIAQGVENNGWGDQGVFVGYACRGDGFVNRELYLARKLNRAIYDAARESNNLGLDIKTQITIDDHGAIDTAIVAVPMQKYTDLTDFIVSVLGVRPRHIIINGTGVYRQHSSIADCGITGRKLACDFYSTAVPIGGGSPWTKDGTKADLTLNLYARYLAIKNLGDNDECRVFLSSCIGRAELPDARIETIKNGHMSVQKLQCNIMPRDLIKLFKLDTPVYAKMCRDGLCDYVLSIIQNE